ncbi:helix-turn-helix transcriptional regulator [Lutibacter citreus]|uniref:helix-turn-helix transcriptional regulator n=1 Tax=Lutibacter citreus TaxID=2138210 RepID=UPI000DBE0C14|nr:LuxR C-terminal-related transcriptional regulator [Lutibacter citreus]
MIKYVFSFILVFTISNSITATVNSVLNDTLNSLNNESERSVFKNSYLRIEKLEQEMLLNKNKGDSIAYLKTKLQLIGKLSDVGRYQQAHKLAWEIYPKINSLEPIELKLDILIRLVRLYVLFEQHKKANDVLYTHFDQTRLLCNKSKDSIYLLGRLYIMQAHLESNVNKNYLKAESILLNCISKGIADNKNNSTIYYAKWQLAELYLTMFRINDAGKLLFDLRERFSGTNKHINTLIYYKIGDYFSMRNEVDSAILNYTKSLKLMNKQELHADYKLEILNNLSQLYFKKGNLLKAYRYVLLSKELGEELFGSKSDQNRDLFELSDEFTKKIQKQKLLLLKKSKSIQSLRMAIYIGILSLMIIIIFFYFIKKAKKNKLEQQQLKEKQEEELKIKETALESKNKKLLSSAMQLIERDSLLKDIKKQLNSLKFNEENKPIIHNILHSLKINRSHKWEEFETHFTAVNHNFFKSLKEKYSELSKTDLKICAFINLGFSSKDIAQIMGIGAESVNVSRSRLRKKLGLEREVNLNEFLQKFYE